MLYEDFKQIIMDCWVAILGTFHKAVVNALMSASVDLWAVCVLAVAVLEELVFNDVIAVLVHLRKTPVQVHVDEVEKFRIKLALSSKFKLICKLFNILIIRVVLKVGFEVVSVLLFLLGQAAEVDSIVFDQALTLALKHALFAAFVVVGVVKLSCIELLNSVEYAIKLPDGKLNIVPSLILSAIERRWQSGELLCHLISTCFVRLEHCVDLLFEFFGPLKLVGWVNQDTVSLVGVNQAVSVGSGTDLPLGLGSFTKEVGQRDLHVFFTDVELGQS